MPIMGCWLDDLRDGGLPTREGFKLLDRNQLAEAFKNIVYFENPPCGLTIMARESGLILFDFSRRSDLIVPPNTSFNDIPNLCELVITPRIKIINAYIVLLNSAIHQFDKSEAKRHYIFRNEIITLTSFFQENFMAIPTFSQLEDINRGFREGILNNSETFIFAKLSSSKNSFVQASHQLNTILESSNQQELLNLLDCIALCSFLYNQGNYNLSLTHAWVYIEEWMRKALKEVYLTLSKEKKGELSHLISQNGKYKTKKIRELTGKDVINALAFLSIFDINEQKLTHALRDRRNDLMHKNLAVTNETAVNATRFLFNILKRLSGIEISFGFTDQKLYVT